MFQQSFGVGSLRLTGPSGQVYRMVQAFRVVKPKHIEAGIVWKFFEACSLEEH